MKKKDDRVKREEERQVEDKVRFGKITIMLLSVIYCASSTAWLKSTPADTSKEENKNAQHHEQPIGNGAVDGKSNADGKQCVTDKLSSVPGA